MERRVWYQFPGGTADFVDLVDGVHSIGDFRGALFTACPHILGRVYHDEVKVYESQALADAKKPLDFSRTVDGLGVAEKQPLRVELVQIIQDGLRLEVPHLEREELLERIYAGLEAPHNRFVVLSSPEGSGKTLLLQLFAQRYSHLNCVSVSFARDLSANSILRRQGEVDIYQQETTLRADQEHVVMIDFAEKKFDDNLYWEALVAAASTWLPPNIRFIIAVTHTLDYGVESPKTFLTMPTIGLPTQMQKPKLIQILVREADGLISVLRVFIDEVVIAFGKTASPSEAELITVCLSFHTLDRMLRCYGRLIEPDSLSLKRFLIKCFVLAPGPVPLGPKLEKELSEKRNTCLVTLKKAGALLEVGSKHVRCSSVLASRYYSRYLLSVPRVVSHPESLPELVLNAIRSVSASALRESAAENGGFPDKVTFLLQFVPGLALNTLRSWLICPELPYILSSPTAGGDRIKVTDALYVNGRRRWGLEVHWDEDADGCTSKFAPGGEYAAMPVDDYALINVWGTKGGVIPKGVTPTWSPRDKEISVFLKLEDFSRCR